MKKIIHLIIVLFLTQFVSAQDANKFTLQDAVEYALQHNSTVKQSQRNILKAKKKVWETTSMGLPQIEGTVSYQKFIEQPVNLMPARIFNPMAPPDTYVPVKFGTEQNMKWSATLSQLIFSGSYLVGLQSAKTYKTISENAAVKTKQKIKESVVNAYGNALLIDESIKITQQNIQTVKQNLFEISEMFKNGLVEETDVEQLQITLSNLQNQLDYLQRMKETAYEMLNFLMGRDIKMPIKLADDTKILVQENTRLNLLQKPFSVEQNIDYLIAKNQEKAKKLQVKFERSKALPTIAAFVNYGKNAYNNDFEFFQDEQPWYEQSLFGVNINIPIFSSWGRTSRVQQAKIDYENAKEAVSNKEKELQLQYAKAKNDFEHSIHQYDVARKNLALAEKIEHKEQIKFKEGVGNSFQLNQARMQLYQTQQKYLQTIIEIINKKVMLENILGE
jgi:outer membrane protein TolC